MTADPDAPLMDAVYYDDPALILRDGKPVYRSAVLLQTAVTGEPAAVFMCYLPASTWPTEPTDDDQPPSHPVRRW